MTYKCDLILDTNGKPKIIKKPDYEEGILKDEE